MASRMAGAGFAALAKRTASFVRLNLIEPERRAENSGEGGEAGDNDDGDHWLESFRASLISGQCLSL
jgi:hypothetical protein